MSFDDVNGDWNAIGVSSDDTIRVLLSNVIFRRLWTNYNVVRLQVR